MSKLIFDHSPWDDGTDIITVRPDWEKLWRCAPIGMCLSKRDAKIIAEWIQGAYKEIEQIVKNGYEEEND